MSRFAFIPLEFTNLTQGLEREIVLKKDTQDIYILDDFKIPVSSTSNLKNAVQEIKSNTTTLENISEIMKEEYIFEKDRILSETNYLNELIHEGESNHFKRINGLEDYQLYLESYRQEINISLEDFKKQIEDMVNIYYADLSSTISSAQSKYNSNKTLYDTYVSYKNTYKNKLSTMESEIATLERELELKLKKLGAGSGSFDTTISKTETVTKEATSWFRWLSNSTSVYPGDRIANSMSDGGSWWSYSASKPLKPTTWFVDSNASSNIDDFEGPSDNPNKYMVNWYWSGSLSSAGFVSSDGIFNQYGRKVVCVYQRQFTENVDVNVSIPL